MNCPHCKIFLGPDLEPGDIAVCCSCAEFCTLRSDDRRVTAVSSSFLARILPRSEIKRLLHVQRLIVGSLAAGATKN